MQRTLPVLILGIFTLLAAAACDVAPVEPDTAPGVTDADRDMTRSAASFRTWRQGFDHGTGGWIDAATPGPGGWCGGIEAVVRGEGPVAPAAGRGYALVRFGDCNEYWAGNGFAAGSGPYSPGAGYATAWPEGGYVVELEIWLDPAWTAPMPFLYTVSFSVLDLAYPNDLRYLTVPVTAGSGGLEVAGHPVGEAGWYTFRHRFADDGGALSVTFELERHGRTLAAVPATSTAFTAEPVRSFEAANTGSGYVWFVSIAPGLDLPVDEHRVRRGG